MNHNQIESLVQKVQSLPDPAARAAALELVQAVMDLHAAGLERIMEIVSDAEAGGTLVDALANDELAGSILLLHDLHPLPLAERVERALDRAEFRSRGARVDVISISEGVVRLHLEGSPALRSAVETALRDAAPDASVILEGIAHPSFVALEQLRAG